MRAERRLFARALPRKDLSASSRGLPTNCGQPVDRHVRRLREREPHDAALPVADRRDHHEQSRKHHDVG